MKIEEFARRHQTARRPLARWKTLVEAATWEKLPDIRSTFPTADKARGSKSLYIFDIGGNKYRLVALVEIVGQEVVIDRIMTHSEYDRWNRRRS